MGNGNKVFSIIEFNKIFVLLVFYLFFIQTGWSQCLTPGNIGTFELTNLSDSWWSATEGKGTFSLDDSEYYSGAKSLKVEVNTASGWQVRTTNQSCTFNLVADDSYRVTVYAKGVVENEIDVALLDNGTRLSSNRIELTSTSWTKYQVVLPSTVNSTLGKVRFAFTNTGTYHIDEVSYEQVSMVSSSVTDANICWEGVLHSEVTGGGEQRVFRLNKDYATNDLSGYYTGLRASSSAGIIMKLKTSSPTVNIEFSEDLTFAGDIYNHKIGVFKDEVFQYSTNEFDLSLSNNSGSSIEWKFVMPTYTQMNLKSIALENGHALETVANQGKPLYVAIGNSITMGVGLTDNESRGAYSRIVADSLNYELYNWGIGGSKIHDTIFSNFQYLSADPELITVLWGYNDVHYSGSDAAYLNSAYPKYEKLLTQILQNYPNTCLVAVLPTYTTNPTSTATRRIDSLEANQLRIIQNLQKVYPKLHYLRGADYTDASGLNDAVHLNNAGNESLAFGILNELNCDVATNISIDKKEVGISIFPNPTSSEIRISDQGYHFYKVYSVDGKLLKEGNVNGQIVSLENLPSGTYLLNLISRDLIKSVPVIKR